MVAPLGILILDTRFPRLPGDIGNPASFPFPVLYERLAGIGPSEAVRDAPGTPQLLDKLEAASWRLIEQGAKGITTSCGFLALFQPDLAARLPVPVATSSLLQWPLVAATTGPGRRAGILTAEAASLTPAHLAAVGVPADAPVQGMPPGGAFARCFLANSTDLDAKAVEAEAVSAAQALLTRHPDLGAIVLECTNLPPYAAAIARGTGLPVYGVIDMLLWFQAGLAPRAYPR